MMVPTHVIMTVLNKAHCPETGRHRRRRRRSRFRSYIILSTIVIIITITVWLVDKSSETDFFSSTKGNLPQFRDYYTYRHWTPQHEMSNSTTRLYEPITVLIVLKFLSESYYNW